MLEKHIFWNSAYLDEYLKACEAKKDDVPGHAYFRKLECFIEQHYEIGDLYMEYTRGNCAKTLGKSNCNSLVDLCMDLWALFYIS